MIKMKFKKILPLVTLAIMGCNDNKDLTYQLESYKKENMILSQKVDSLEIANQNITSKNDSLTSMVDVYETREENRHISVLPNIKQYLGEDWDKTMNRFVEAFSKNPTSYGNKKRISLVYGLFGQANYTDDIFNQFYCHNEKYKWEGCKDGVVENVVYKIFESPKLQRALFEFAKPRYETAFKSLDDRTQNDYIEMFEHAKKYLTNFNPNNEKIRMEFDVQYKGHKNDKGYSEDESEFFEYTVTNPYVKLDAFLRRRYFKGDMTIEQMSDWVNEIHDVLIEWKGEK